MGRSAAGVGRRNLIVLAFMTAAFVLAIVAAFVFVVVTSVRNNIHGAAKADDAADVERILDRAPEKLEARSGLGTTPLHSAAWNGSTNALAVLIRRGADVNAVWDYPATGDGGWNALHITAINGRDEAAEVLIRAGADVNRRSVRGETPLDIAAKNGHLRLVEVLRANGGVGGRELR